MRSLLSDKQRGKVQQLIVDHHLAFAVEVLGPTAVTRADYERLLRQGILKSDDLAHTQVAFPAAQTLGMLSSKTDLQLARMKPDAFWDYVALRPPQFSAHELDAIDATRAHVGLLIKNLGTNLLNEFANASRDEETKLRHEALMTVQHEIALGVARRKSKEQIVRRLKAKLGASERDWALVVATELHNAHEQGKALAIAHGGRNPLVYKLPRPDACRFCKLLYLNGNRPRLFRLSELVQNGTNVGRRAGRPSLGGAGATEWRPTVGCVHPGCQCELHELPEGKAFSKDGTLINSVKKSMADALPATIRALINHRCEHVDAV